MGHMGNVLAIKDGNSTVNQGNKRLMLNNTGAIQKQLGWKNLITNIMLLWGKIR